MTEVGSADEERRRRVNERKKKLRCQVEVNVTGSTGDYRCLPYDANVVCEHCSI